MIRVGCFAEHFFRCAIETLRQRGDGEAHDFGKSLIATIVQRNMYIRAVGFR